MRKFLEAMAAAGASELVLDHLVWCVNSVSEGMDMFEALTGVRPCTGGQHLGLGTHNALVSLGDGLYLEILASLFKTGNFLALWKGFLHARHASLWHIIDILTCLKNLENRRCRQMSPDILN